MKRWVAAGPASPERDRRIPAIGEQRTWAYARKVSAHSSSRFLLVGALSYLVDLGTLAALHSGLGMALAPATTLAFATTLGINFGLNRVFAFRSTSLAGPALAKYIGLVGVNYVTTLAIVTGLSATGLSYVLAKTIATALNAILNYVAFKRWVFKN